MTIYNYSAVEDLFNRYAKKDPEFRAYTIPGSLIDNYILTGQGLKTAIIKEVYLNEWSSAVKIRMYNRCPKKYAEIINLIEDSDPDDEEKQAEIFKKFMED